jgi:uncharacterized protein involved in response to NO
VDVTEHGASRKFNRKGDGMKSNSGNIEWGLLCINMSLVALIVTVGVSGARIVEAVQQLEEQVARAECKR